MSATATPRHPVPEGSLIPDRGGMIPYSATIADVADWLRSRFPDAVAVSLFVNHEGHEVETRYRDKSNGISMRALDGSWAVSPSRS